MENYQIGSIDVFRFVDRCTTVPIVKGKMSILGVIIGTIVNRNTLNSYGRFAQYRVGSKDVTIQKIIDK